MKRQLLIKNGTVVDPVTKALTKRDVLLENGIIIDVSEKDDSIVKEIDASGHFVSPGWVDFHCHIFYGGSGLALSLIHI